MLTIKCYVPRLAIGLVQECGSLHASVVLYAAASRLTSQCKLSWTSLCVNWGSHIEPGLVAPVPLLWRHFGAAESA